MDGFFTWQMLMTYSGAVLATTVITQFLKGLPFIVKIPTRVVSYVIALAVMIGAMLFTDGFSWSGIAMAFINAVVVALASNGAFDAVTLKSSGKTE